MGRGGLEPPGIRRRADLQSAAIAAMRPTQKMARGERIELSQSVLETNSPSLGTLPRVKMEPSKRIELLFDDYKSTVLPLN